MDMDMNPAWLTYPLALEGSREFDCGEKTPEECAYYTQRWHFWYKADLVFALPTIAFFMCSIGIFILGHILSSYILGYRRFRGPAVWQKLIAGIRYLSYKGYHVKALQWSSAPVGVLLLGLAGAMFFFLMDLVPQPYYWSDEKFGGSPPLATRSGWLALACMPFVFATASKTNWITALTGVSHERLQVFHRWISYAFFLLALLHTFPFIVYHVHFHDMESHFSESLLFYWTGIVALIAQAWLTFASHSTIRNIGYEFFKFTHFLAAVIFMVTFFWHCDATLTSWDYFVATAAVYVPCYAYSWIRTLIEHGRLQATIHVEDNGFTHITIPAKFDWKPGQHCFLRFTGFGIYEALSTHPFTICSSPPAKPSDPSELVFYIRHQRGFTAKLYQLGLDQPGVSVPVFVDGPYGGVNLQRYRDSDHLLVIAGGSGAGWCLPLIERFVRGFGVPSKQQEEESPIERKSPGPQSVRVILATRDMSSRLWFERTVGELLAKYSHTASTLASSLRVQVYLTGDAADKAHLDTSSKSQDRETSPPQSISSSSKIEVPVSTEGKGASPPLPGKEFEGRPALWKIIKEEASKAAGVKESLSVFVCGPDVMQNDVRNAVAEANMSIVKGTGGSAVYLHSEHFSWA